MKDLYIKKSVLRRELIVWLVSFCVAIAVNIYAIALYDSPWVELITQIHNVLILSLVLYFIAALLRGVVHLVRLPFRKKE